MKRAAWTLLVLAAALGTVWALRRPSPKPGLDEAVVISPGPFSVWSSYPGRVESRRVETIAARYPGSATLIELIPEGVSVAPGDVLARFDSSSAEAEWLKARHRLARARAALQAIVSAEIPLSIAELDAQLAEARGQWTSEQQLLEDTRELVARGLISQQELDQQDTRVRALAARVRRLEQQRRLTVEYLHPAREAQARADVEAEEQQVATFEDWVSRCTLRAPCRGTLLYQPVPFGSELRPARIGDTLFQNQPFLLLVDMTDLVVTADIPEADVRRVKVGGPATVRPVALPDHALRATVETLSSTAEARPGHPPWQKFLRLRARLEDPPGELRPGMTVTLDLLVYHQHSTLTLPRSVVLWRGGRPWCRVQTAQGQEDRLLRLGPGNEIAFEVLEGLRPGEWVLRP